VAAETSVAIMMSAALAKNMHDNDFPDMIPSLADREPWQVYQGFPILARFLHRRGHENRHRQQSIKMRNAQNLVSAG
jgi:hypothetical protein